MYLKGKDKVIADALNKVSPLKPEPAQKTTLMQSQFITSEVLATQSQLEKVRLTMQADPILSQLKYQVFQEWPDARRSLPESIHPFWNYKDELLVEDRLILKAHKLVIPASQKQEFLRD